MRQLRFIPIMAVAAIGLATMPATSASAIDVPTGEIEFDLNIVPPAAKPGRNIVSTSCIPLSIASNNGNNSVLKPKQKKNPRTNSNISAAAVAAGCKIQRVLPSQEWTGTVSSTQLAALESGFNTGTFSARCNSQRQLSMSLILSRGLSAPRTVKDQTSNASFNACRFTLTFGDTQSSSLIGTIRVAIKLGSDAGLIVNGVIPTTYSAVVNVTEGTGAFAGFTGSGNFASPQSTEFALVRGGGGTNAARIRATIVRSILTTEKMTLSLAKSAS
jgi:hypothetical protein